MAKVLASQQVLTHAGIGTETHLSPGLAVDQPRCIVVERLEHRVFLNGLVLGDVYPIGGASDEQVLVDFNADGFTDVLTNSTNARFVLFLGQGNGSLQPRRLSGAGQVANDLSVGDVNGDGCLDVVSANGGSADGTVGVWLGNGGGTFSAESLVTVGFSTRALTLADLNGDRILDLLVANGDSSYGGQVLLGTGAGSFQVGVTFQTGQYPSDVVAADMNGDTILDIITANAGGSISVLLGNGDGTLQAERRLSPFINPRTLAVADCNRDGKPDIVAVGSVPTRGGRLVALLGAGDGTFLVQSSHPFASDPYAIAVGDVNGDDKVDVFSGVGSGGSGMAYMALGNGDGTYQTAVSIRAGPHPRGIGVADMNRDGKMDLIASGSHAVGIHLGNGDATFRMPPTLSSVVTGPLIAPVDLNGDGKMDLVTVEYPAYDSGTLNVLLGDGNGAFSALGEYVVGRHPTSLSIADLDSDGKLDAVVANTSSTSLSILKGNGDGTFHTQQSLDIGGSSQDAIIADVNGDTKPDIVTANGHADGGRVGILIGGGDGSFRQHDYATNGWPISLVVVDVNNDEKLDIVTASRQSNTIMIMIGNGDGSFQSPRSLPVNPDVIFVRAADVNNDGNADLVATSTWPGTSVFLGVGDGNFLPPITRDSSTWPRRLFDIDGDGNVDLLFATPQGVGLERGNGDGTFKDFEIFATHGVGVLIVADVNDDNKPDVVIGSTVLLNQSTPLSVVGSVAQDSAQQFHLAFSDPVGTSLDLGDLVLTDMATGQLVSAASLSLEMTLDLRSATVTVIGNTLLDGNYRLMLRGISVQDDLGQSLPADFVIDFHILAADANRDRKVDLQDLMVLANNWMGTGKTFSQGDFNYDGVVNAVDLGILATRWQQRVDLPVATSPLPTAPRPASRTPSRTPTRVSAEILR